MMVRVSCFLAYKMWALGCGFWQFARKQRVPLATLFHFLISHFHAAQVTNAHKHESGSVGLVITVKCGVLLF